MDTAGRLHTKSGLMDELDKMRRTAAKLIPGAPHRGAAGDGRDDRAEWIAAGAAVHRSRRGVTGIVLTKLDGTAKGGIVRGHRHRAWPAGKVRRRRRKDGRHPALRQRRVCGFDSDVEWLCVVGGSMNESSEGPSREQQNYWQEFVQLKVDTCYVRDYRNYLGKWVTVTFGNSRYCLYGRNRGLV